MDSQGIAPVRNSGSLPELLLRSIAAADFCEARLRELARNRNDDDEVQAFLAAFADQTKSDRGRVAARLSVYSNTASDDKVSAVASSDVGLLEDKDSPAGLAPEESTLQNLLTAYTLAADQIGMYELLAATARLSSDTVTEELSRQIQRAAQLAADTSWHFLPSRSKIAFNMLTVSEIDPAVETKTPDARLLGD